MGKYSLPLSNGVGDRQIAADELQLSPLLKSVEKYASDIKLRGNFKTMQDASFEVA